MDFERYLVYELVIDELASGESSPLTVAIRESLVAVEHASPTILKRARESAFAARMSYASDYLLVRGIQPRSLTMKDVEADDSIVAIHAPQYHRERLVVYIRSIRKFSKLSFSPTLRAKRPALNAALANWTTQIMSSTGQAKLAPVTRFTARRSDRIVALALHLNRASRTVAMLGRAEFRSGESRLTDGEDVLLHDLMGRTMGGFSVPLIVKS
ncbi:MAG: hypothetical protein NVSMB64_01170 [Candidatus Velthaea sp.]